MGLAPGDVATAWVVALALVVPRCTALVLHVPTGAVFVRLDADVAAVVVVSVKVVVAAVGGVLVMVAGMVRAAVAGGLVGANAQHQLEKDQANDGDYSTAPPRSS